MGIPRADSMNAQTAHITNARARHVKFDKFRVESPVGPRIRSNRWFY